jgi:hypothetical protein
MACRVPLLGMVFYHYSFLKILQILSAEVVVQMLMAEHFGEPFSIPSWLPQRYLTYVRDK